MFTLEVDKGIISQVEKLISKDEFTQFLLNNTTDIAAAGFILSTLFTAIDEIKKQLN